MSHEIRTPMNAILGFTDVLRRGYGKSLQDPRKYLNTIHSSGTHLLDLINDILDLSKVESGRLEVERISCSPFQIANDVIQVLNVKAAEKELNLSFDVEGEIPVTIQSDPSRLRQILMNLVGNAIKFTEQGEVQIILKFKTGNQPQLQFDVCDSGIGMTPQQLKKIFDPFSQADSSVTRRFGGTGLGLSISQRLAEALGGKLEVTSEVGVGSVFSLMVVTGDLAGVELKSAAEYGELSEVDLTPQSEWVFDSQSVLVVDDGPENRELVRVVLEEAGLQIHTAENGQQAVDLCSRQTFDLILMDMQMPVMDGYTAARTMRETGNTTPIIALTANAMKGSEQECLEAGCTGFLTKPIDIDQLVSRIATTLEVEQTTAPETESASPVNAGSTTVDQPPKDSSDAICLSPLVSELPTEFPEFQKIVEDFIPRLSEQLDAMELALQQQDLATVKSIAHWLKGAGGTVGFPQFTEPSLKMEQSAGQGSDDELQEAFLELQQLAARVRVCPVPN